MAVMVHDGMLNLLAAGEDWSMGDYGAALFLKDGWTPAKADTNVAAVIIDGATEVSAAGYARQALAGLLVDADPTNHKSHQICDQIEFGSPVTGDDYDVVVVYAEGATDADRTMLFTFDVTGGPLSTDGNPVNAVPNVNALWDLQSA